VTDPNSSFVGPAVILSRAFRHTSALFVSNPRSSLSRCVVFQFSIR
jgi:hypothetical protein